MQNPDARKKTDRDSSDSIGGMASAQEAEELLRPIERVAVNEQILSRLKQFLQSNQLKVGAKLPSERQLSAMLKVSRHSVREALSALSILGVISSEQGKGTYLASQFPSPIDRPEQILTLQEGSRLVYLWEARSALEPYTASLAAVHASDVHLRKASECLALMRKSLTDREEFARNDMLFHLALVEASDNPVLTEITSIVIRNSFTASADLRILDFAGDVPQKYGVLTTFLSHHEKILAAVRRGDTASARSRMLGHLRLVGQHDLRLVRARAAHAANAVIHGETSRQAVLTYS
jgi:GntR family transcriptional repressor for pyruvate dehydrogenase complex